MDWTTCSLHEELKCVFCAYYSTHVRFSRETSIVDLKVLQQKIVLLWLVNISNTGQSVLYTLRRKSTYRPPADVLQRQVGVESGLMSKQDCWHRQLVVSSARNAYILNMLLYPTIFGTLISPNMYTLQPSLQKCTMVWIGSYLVLILTSVSWLVEVKMTWVFITFHHTPTSQKFNNYNKQNNNLKSNFCFWTPHLHMCLVRTLTLSLSCCGENIIKVLLHAQVVVKCIEVINVVKFKLRLSVLTFCNRFINVFTNKQC